MPRWITILLLIFQFIWSIRGLVILSFIAHLALALLAGVRRRQATGVRTSILWLANQWARWAPITALGMLSVGSTPQQEQLVTLWAAFMLLHAAMPDNIAAYSLEDTVLSIRQKAEMQYQLFGPVSPISILVKNFFSNGDSMLWVSSVVCLMAIGKYLEGAYQALSRGNLKNMRSSRKKNKSPKSRRNSLQILRRGGREPNDEQILLAAHDMLYITKDAFIDYLDQNNGYDDVDEQAEALSDTWDEKLYTVVNMELSLMYDLIYTKAAMVHTWKGYALRFAFPIAGATAFMLFCLHSKEGQSTADVMITYVLLAGTVILDIKWLLRAVASTWFYSFLNETPRSWLHHAILCSGKWRLIRRLIVSELNLFRLLANNKKATSYRMWSGKIGQFNLLHECTRYENETRTKTNNYMISSLFMRCASEDIRMEYEYQRVRGNRIDSKDFSKELFNSIWQVMKKPFPERPPSPPPSPPSSLKAMEKVGLLQEADIALKFTPDLQETILIFHIATDIFLLLVESDTIEASSKSRQQVKAIKALSNYMMFLVAVRPTLLPGLVLSSRYEAVRDALARIWKKNGGSDPSSRTSSSTTREKRLAEILFALDNKEGTNTKRDDSRPDRGFLSVLYDTSNVLSEGALLARFLLGKITSIDSKLEEKFDRQFPDLMELYSKNGHCPSMAVKTDAIVREWARQLINVSIRCTRDSHAKQLARGGEFTTVVWILAEHAHILRVKKPTVEQRIDVPPYRESSSTASRIDPFDLL